MTFFLSLLVVWLAGFLGLFIGYGIGRQFHTTIRSPWLDRVTITVGILLTVTVIFYPSPALLMVFGLMLSILAGGCRGTSDDRSESLPTPNSYYFYGAMVLVAGILVFIRAYRLGATGLILDEPWHFGTAVGYLRTGRYVLWDFVHQTIVKAYPRASTYTWQVAQSIRLFDLNLHSARLPSLVWGSLTLIPLLLVVRTINDNRWLHFTTAVLFTISPYAIATSRWVRHYSFFGCLYLCFLLICWYGIDQNNRSKRFFYWTLGLLLFLMLLHLHPAPALLSLAGLGIFFMVEIILSPEKFRELIRSRSGWMPLAVGGVLGICLALMMTLTAMGPSIPWSEIGLPNRLSLFYAVFLNLGLFGYAFGGLATATVLLELNRNRTERYWSVALFAVLGFTFFNQRPQPQIRYVGHLILLAIPLTVVSLYRFINNIFQKNNYFKVTFILIVILMIPFTSVLKKSDRLRAGESEFIAFPGKRSKQYGEVLKTIRRTVPEDAELIVLDLPSYHANQLQRTREKFYYQSFFESRWSEKLLRKRVPDPETAWILSVFSYRDPTSPSLQDFLNRYHRPIDLTLPSGVTLYRPIQE
jgi:hypothetical protein